jgi:transposase InsO family protein
MGITKCRARARETVWWPGISQQIEEMVKRCEACIMEQPQPKEPLIPSEFPERPWQKLAMDLFYLNKEWFLVVTDYYSRYPELAALDKLNSSAEIRHCKAIFARHGVPETVVSDNGPQFQPLKTRDYGFSHVTPSPKYPQSNGFAEAAVKIVKLRMKKSKDPLKALLEYRATPLLNGYSPAEL